MVETGRVMVTTWTLLFAAFRIHPVFSTCPRPPNFPSHIPLAGQAFSNWAGTIKVGFLWTALPDTAEDVVDLANWAHSENYKMRPLGYGLGWSPGVVSASQNCRNIVAVNTTSLNSMEVSPDSSSEGASVVVGAGASMDDFLNFLEKHGFGVNHVPVSGHITIGAVLSGGGHGTAVAADLETLQPGFTFGSLSNLVLSITAVIWNDQSSAYELKTFYRNESETKALIVNLGRSFLTQATLRTGSNYNVQCVSRVDIPASELYKDPTVATKGDKTFASFIGSSGRISSIFFAFSTNPWIRVFYVKPEKPDRARQVSKPYAFPFSDNVPAVVSDILPSITNGLPWITPVFGNTQSIATSLGLAATMTFNLWGPSKNLLLYVKPTTLRITTNGYAIITKRDNIQLIVSQYMAFFKNLLDTYKSNGKYPVNVGNELRVTGLDNPDDVEIDGAESPSLAPSTLISNHPEFDVAIWVDTITLPGTRFEAEFAHELETYLLSNFDESVAIVRPEWSKGFAFTTSEAWKNLDVLQKIIPTLYSDWNSTVNILNKYDPNRIFTNDLLDALML